MKKQGASTKRNHGCRSVSWKLAQRSMKKRGSATLHTGRGLSRP
jgi:hypothetical protein